MDGKAASLIVELTNPALSDGTLTFDYVLLKGEDSVTLDRSYMVLDETWWGNIDYSIDKLTGNQEGAATMEQLPD
ncbi:hypothetical protein [uncultured Ruegeria sp.]|uniref:hypothetical protein n=1 Tax=uncultured Ruegeria sp. TaxID=259304 RepID=UPI0026379EFD|nr:hypothetical protein [uncultured Ruegeria sp.]